jgi:hypothetical protein
MDVQGCAEQNESRIDGVHEKLYADEGRQEVLVRLDLSCSVEAADLRAQFRHVRHKGGAGRIPMKMVMKSCNFGSVAKGPMPKGPTKKITAARVKILDLDIRAAVDYHSHPGVMSRTWKSKAEFHDDFYKVLKKTGEHDPTGKGMAKMGSGCTT